jgi:hypothetical protein
VGNLKWFGGCIGKIAKNADILSHITTKTEEKHPKY